MPESKSQRFKAYPIEVVDRDPTGYSSRYDAWKISSTLMIDISRSGGKGLAGSSNVTGKTAYTTML
jgi:hypothetical protein